MTTFLTLATSVSGIRLTPLVLTGVVTTATATADETKPGRKSPLHIG